VSIEESPSFEGRQVQKGLVSLSLFHFYLFVALELSRVTSFPSTKRKMLTAFDRHQVDVDQVS
jgi:hypothetical protein